MLHLLLFPLALAGDHAAQHPTDANLYFEVSDLPALVEAYQSAPVLQLLGDPEWSRFAAGVMDIEEEGFELDQWCLDYFISSLDELEEFAADDVDLRSAFGGLQSFSLSLHAPQLHERQAQSAPDFFAQLGMVLVLDYATPDNAQAGVDFCVGALQLLPEQVQHKQAPLSLMGQEGLVQRYRHTRPGDRLELWSAVCGSSVVFGIGTMTPENWRALGDATDRQLRGNADFALESRSSVDDGSIVKLYDAYFDVGGLPCVVDALRDELGDEQLEGWLVTLGEIAIDAPFATRCSSHLAGDRFYHDMRWSGSPLLPGVGAVPVTRRAAELLPPETVGAWCTGIDGVRLESQLLQLVAAWQGSDSDGARRFLTEEVGLDLRADLLEPLGSDAGFYLKPFAGPTLPEFGLVMDLEDRERLVAALDKLFDAIEERATEGIELRSGRYRGQNVYSLQSNTSDWDLPDLGSMNILYDMLRPGISIAVMDDRVLVSMERRFVTRQVKRILKAEEDAPLHPITDWEAFDADDVVCVSMLDWGACLGSLYETVRALAPLAGDGMLPFDLSGLPPTEALTRHFRPGLAWMRAVEGGTLSYAESSFGPASTLAVTLIPFASLFGFSAEDEPPVAPGPVTEPVDSGASTDGTGGEQR